MIKSLKKIIKNHICINNNKKYIVCFNIVNKKIKKK